MTNLESIFKSRDITLPTKVRLVKAIVFPVVMYGCESWTVKKAERRRIGAFLTVVLEKTPESPLDCKEIQPVHSFFFFFYFILLYNTVLVLPYTNMNPPRVYTCSPS